MRNAAFTALCILLIAIPVLSSARVPPSMLKESRQDTVKSKYGETRRRLKKEGYGKGVHGLDLGYIREGFKLEAGKGIYVAPLKNLARQGSSPLADTLADETRRKMAEFLKETGLFTQVSTTDRNADYVLELYIMEIRTDFNIWVQGSECVWGVNLYDAKRNLLMAGYDKITSDSYSKDVEFLMYQVPGKALLFVCRSNPPFNNEYVRLLRTRKLDWKIWQ